MIDPDDWTPDIEAAQSLERLDWIAEVIKFDIDDGFEFKRIAAMRAAFIKRRKELRDELH